MINKHKIIPNTVSDKKRIEAYLRFVVFFNKFINHKKKTHRQFIEREMKI